MTRFCRPLERAAPGYSQNIQWVATPLHCGLLFSRCIVVRARAIHLPIPMDQAEKYSVQETFQAATFQPDSQQNSPWRIHEDGKFNIKCTSGRPRSFRTENHILTVETLLKAVPTFVPGDRFFMKFIHAHTIPGSSPVAVQAYDTDSQP